MSEAAKKKKKKKKMKKFVRKRKTFASAEAQTAVGEVYILDAVRGGSADRGGGGLVRELRNQVNTMPLTPKPLLPTVRLFMYYIFVLHSLLSSYYILCTDTLEYSTH